MFLILWVKGYGFGIFGFPAQRQWPEFCVWNFKFKTLAGTCMSAIGRSGCHDLICA